MNSGLLISPKLQQEDLVRLVSPARDLRRSDIVDNINILESWGLRCDTRKHILDEHGYMAGSDVDRLVDPTLAFWDPKVRAIIAIRGGGVNSDAVSAGVEFSGKAQGKIIGVVLGSSEGLRDFSDRGWNILDVLHDRHGMLNVPVPGENDAGHDLTDDKGDPDQYALPLGSFAIFDTGEGILSIAPIECWSVLLSDPLEADWLWAIECGLSERSGSTVPVLIGKSNDRLLAGAFAHVFCG